MMPIAMSEEPPDRLPTLPGSKWESLVELLGGLALPSVIMLLELFGVSNGGWPMYGVATVLYAYALYLHFYPDQVAPVDTWYNPFGGYVDHRGHLAYEYARLCRECALMFEAKGPHNVIRYWIIKAPIIHNCIEETGDEGKAVRLNSIGQDEVQITHICYIPVMLDCDSANIQTAYLIGALVVRNQSSRLDIGWEGTGILASNSNAYDIDIASQLRLQMSQSAVGRF